MNDYAIVRDLDGNPVRATQDAPGARILHAVRYQPERGGDAYFWTWEQVTIPFHVLPDGVLYSIRGTNADAALNRLNTARRYKAMLAAGHPGIRQEHIDNEVGWARDHNHRSIAY